MARESQVFKILVAVAYLAIPIGHFSFECQNCAEISERSNQTYYHVKPYLLVLRLEGECTSPVAHSLAFRMKFHKGHSTYGFKTNFQTAKPPLLPEILSSKLTLWLKF